MSLLRTRFKDEILAEFLPPITQSDKVVIFCDGLPSVPNKRRLLEFWSKKGYWTIHPRYRGAWESGGEFLLDSPEKDILDVIDELSKGLTDLWDNTFFSLDPKEIYIVGGSFGGAAALLLSRDPRVNKVIAISPVVDWTAPSEDEPLEIFGPMVRRCFGSAYRGKKDVWQKLATGTFYNPVAHANQIDGKKVMIIHAADDRIVGAKKVIEFANTTKSTFCLLKKGGHLSSSIIMKFGMYWRVKKFIHSKQ